MTRLKKKHRLAMVPVAKPAPMQFFWRVFVSCTTRIQKTNSENERNQCSSVFKACTKGGGGGRGVLGSGFAG